MTETPPEPTEVRTVALAEGDVEVRILGTGPPILFLHGLSARGRSWLPVARELGRIAPGFQRWLPDLLGRGSSAARPDLSYRLEDETRRAREMLDLLAAEGRPAVVAGHSQGAAIALALAAGDPAIRGLLLSNPIPPDLPRPRALALLASRGARSAIGRIFASRARSIGRLVVVRAAGPGFRASPELVRAYADPYLEPERARTLMRILHDWRPRDLATRMPERELLAHVVAGAHDPRVPPASARRLARRLGAAWTLVEDGGHILPEQHPRLLAETLAGLAERAAGTSGGRPPGGPTRASGA